MRKNVVSFLFAVATLCLMSPAFAYDNLCANIADPTARIHCWQKGPAFSGLVAAQHAARCPDKSTNCFHEVLHSWWVCLPYAQSAGVAYTNTRGFADLPPDQWNPTVQKVDANLTVGPYGPQTMKANYAKMIAAEAFGTDWFGNNATEATSYVMNMCLDDRLF
jgi:hypothetical protein